MYSPQGPPGCCIHPLLGLPSSAHPPVNAGIVFEFKGTDTDDNVEGFGDALSWVLKTSIQMSIGFGTWLPVYVPVSFLPFSEPNKLTHFASHGDIRCRQAGCPSPGGILLISYLYHWQSSFRALSTGRTSSHGQVSYAVSILLQFSGHGAKPPLTFM